MRLESNRKIQDIVSQSKELESMEETDLYKTELTSSTVNFCSHVFILPTIS
jgi:hypothetical protein